MKTPYFDNQFFEHVPDDTLLGLMAVCSEFKKVDGTAVAKPEYLEDYLHALGVFKGLAITRDYTPSYPSPLNTAEETIRAIRQFFVAQEAEHLRQINTIFLEQQTTKYADRFTADSAYVFPDDDYQRIQELINEIRDTITASEVITARHKRRLLERLERMQKELHRVTSDLDRFWGFVGEAGVVLGRFGKDVQPLVDLVEKLVKIVGAVIIIKEGFLGGTPLLKFLPDPGPNNGNPDDTRVA